MAFSGTTTGSTDLQALRQEIERDRRVTSEHLNALNERLKAIDLVEQMERERIHRKHDHPGISAIQKVFADDGSVKDAGSLIEAVKIAIKYLGTQEFSVREIEAYLNERGYPLPEVEPRSRIAMAFQTLVTRGQIEKTFEGAGPVPHRYKATK